MCGQETEKRYHTDEGIVCEDCYDDLINSVIDFDRKGGGEYDDYANEIYFRN